MLSAKLPSMTHSLDLMVPSLFRTMDRPYCKDSRGVDRPLHSGMFNAGRRVMLTEPDRLFPEGYESWSGLRLCGVVLLSQASEIPAMGAAFSSTFCRWQCLVVSEDTAA